jgi:hypothetical protein
MAGLKSLNIADPWAWLSTLARVESLQVLMAFAVCVMLSWVIVWGIRKALAWKYSLHGSGWRQNICGSQ